MVTVGTEKKSTATGEPDAFFDDAIARFLLHDRDATFDAAFGHGVDAFGLTSLCTSPNSPWQKPYVERVIGSIRRECVEAFVSGHLAAIGVAPKERHYLIKQR